MRISADRTEGAMSRDDNFVGTREVSDAHRFDTHALTSVAATASAWV